MKTFSMEELLPVVAELADQYTSKESTSITYEKAQQLMEGVLYCINEFETHVPGAQELLLKENELSAKTIYNLGYDMVLQKVKDTQKQYNAIIQDFRSYGNRCCYETFVKGLPAYFLYYNPRFNPQNHILTLDYPVLFPMESLQGADAVSVYVNCAHLEQMFLKALPQEYVMHVLRAYSVDCDDLIINLAAIAARNLLGSTIAGKRVDTFGYNQVEQERVIEYVNENTEESLERNLQKAVDELMTFLFDGNVELGNYLKMDLHNFSFELKNAVHNGCLESVLAIK